tara:strand:+ start:165 stop:650 length:486 start_codon:yes stop_codon:yes gene_type:complete
MISKKISIFYIFALLIFLSACGFEPIRFNNINKISVIDITSAGDQNINFKLTNYLKQVLGFKKDNPIKIKIKLDTKQDKSIKEKNNKNEITKYTISVKSKVRVTFLNDIKEINFNIVKKNQYKVNDQFSITSSNERESVNQIIKSLSDEIFQTILIKINDN